MFKGTSKFIIISQVFIVSIFAFSLLFLNKKLSNSEVQNVINSTIESLTHDVQDQVHQMITITESLASNRDITNRVFNKNFSSVAPDVAKYLKTVESLNKVSSLWYLSSDGKVLARGHIKDNLGEDLSHTEAFKMVKEQKSYGMSFAIGPSGQPTINLITPIFEDQSVENIKGYIQVATPLKELFNDLKYETGMRLAILFEKEALNKESWNLGRVSAQSAWDDMEKWVLVSFTGPAKYRSDYLAYASGAQISSKVFSTPLKLNDQFVPSTKVLLFVDEVNILSLAEKLSWLVILLIIVVSSFTVLALYYVNQRMMAQQQQLDMAAKMSTLGELSSGIIHEIKNPLAVIQTSSAILKALTEQDTLDKEKVLKHSSKITSMVYRITKIANIISIYSRKSDNDPFEKTNVSSIVEDSLELVREPLMKRSIELKTEIVDTPIECRGIQLSQVVVNLLKNAADAIANNDDKWIVLKTEMSPSSDKVIMTVTDSGKGLPSDVAENIFKKFYTTKGAGQGTGLGLSICQSIVDAHRGKIYVDHRSQNTRFVVELPISQAS